MLIFVIVLILANFYTWPVAVTVLAWVGIAFKIIEAFIKVARSKE